MRQSLAALAVAALSLVAAPSRGDVVYSTIGSTYSQSFNTLATTGTANTWTDDSTITGWFSTATTYRASIGSENNGALYSYGSASSTDRALGSVASGSSGTIRYGVRLTNNTGKTLQKVTVTFDGEQWRRESNATQQKLDFAYIAAESPTLSAGTYTDFDSLDFTGPQAASGTATALDGNLSANRVAAISATITVNWNPGQEIFLRWTDLNDSGNDHGLSIDNVSVVAAVPEISSFVFGGTICTLAGLCKLRRNRRRELAMI